MSCAPSQLTIHRSVTFLSAFVSTLLTVYAIHLPSGESWGLSTSSKCSRSSRFIARGAGGWVTGASGEGTPDNAEEEHARVSMMTAVTAPRNLLKVGILARERTSMDVLTLLLFSCMSALRLVYLWSKSVMVCGRQRTAV